MEVWRYGVVGKEGMEVWGGREGRYGGMGW